MVRRRIRLDGPRARGKVVDAALLRNLLGIVIDGSQAAVRLRTQGRSKARGVAPKWILAASEFALEILDGSTVLEIEAPTLFEADPEEFRQGNLFPEIDPDLSSFDYLVDSLLAAMDGEERSSLYDPGMLRTLRALDSVFDRGVSKLTIEAQGIGNHERSVQVSRSDIAGLSALEDKIPPPQAVRVAGNLDSIRHSDRTFTLLVSDDQIVRGIAETAHLDDLQALWGKRVAISGTAYFTATGRILRIEAESFRAATDGDLEIWARVPEPVRIPIHEAQLRVPQGPRSGINAVIGKWPGDETDEEVKEALGDMS